jgi:2-oxoglutarate ferredoxin oxidoreductase subunit beta
VLKRHERYFRIGLLPHIWCPGCGHGVITNALVWAIDAARLDQDRTVIVSGIGCSSRATGYLNFDTLHTTHGRALAFATGLKLARPELSVVVIAGDGDLAAIGGNHLIHAARRNIDITTVCYNNSIYGMTGGQCSPLTPAGRVASTAPYGNVDRAFDMCELVKAAGATYVARSTTYHARQLVRLLTSALRHRGFAFVEVASPCPTYYGRQNGFKSAVDMLEFYRQQSVSAEVAAGMSAAERAGRLIIGELHRSDAPEFVSEYERLRATARGEGGGHGSL